MTPVVTLMCIRSSQVMVDILPSANERVKPFPVNTGTENTAASKNDHAVQEREEVMQKIDSNVTTGTADKQKRRNHSSIEYLKATSRSLNAGMDRGESPVAGSSTYSSSKPLIVIGENSVKRIRYPINHKFDNTTVDDVYEESNLVVDKRTYRNINRSNDGNLYAYSTSDEDLPTDEVDVSRGYYNVNDLSHNTIDKQNMAEETGRITNHDTKTIRSWVTSSGAFGESGRGTGDFWSQYPAGHGIYRPSALLSIESNRPSKAGEDYEEPSSDAQTRRKIGWKNIGILALVKLGLMTIKTVGFLQFLFLLAFKLKSLMAAVSFKFLLFLKSFKILALPTFLLTLLPVFTSAVQTNGFLREIFGNGGIRDGSYQAGYSGSSDISGGYSSGGSSSSSSSSGGFLQFVFGGEFPTDGTIRTVHPSETPSFPVDDSNPLDGRNYALKRLLSAMDYFRNSSDSDKCVVRTTACQMAFAEEAGIVPLWINRVLYRVSNFISNDKLQLYFKTYGDVQTDIYNKSPEIQDNWKTWCFENYNC